MNAIQTGTDTGANAPSSQAPEADTKDAPPLAVLTGLDIDALPLHDARHSGELERLHARALPPHTLMQRAGLALARLTLAVAPHSRRIEIVAGPGNNGGDGFEAAIHLHRWGKAVRVWWLGSAERQPPDALTSRQAALASGVEIQALGVVDAATESHRAIDAAFVQAIAGAHACDLIVDALLGRGLNRPAQDRLSSCISAMNASAAAVLAVDLPSGLNGDTGAWTQPDGAHDIAVVGARWTLALLSPAPGIFTGMGRDSAGDVWWHDLAVDLDAISPQARLERGAALARLAQPRRHVQHKGSFGDVWVVGGATSMAGAAWLAARSALQCGAGRVYVDLLDPDARRTDPLHPELMLGSMPTAERLAMSTVIAGCGGGADIAERLPMLIAHAGRLVLDADALNAVAADDELGETLRRRGESHRPTVITPHPLEAARLLGCSAAQIQSDRLAAARTLAERWQLVAVLKGSGTVIASPGQTPAINASGNAALATPGSGDVLAGCLGGLWSRSAGLSHDLLQSLAADRVHALGLAHEAALAACHLHGRTAQTMSPLAEAWPAGRLAEGLGDELRRIAQARRA